MINSLKLKEKIQNSKYNLETIAIKLGCNERNLEYKIENKSEFYVSEIARIIKLLHLTEEEQVLIFFDGKIDK